MGEPVEPAGIDVSRPHPARRYNYWLGGDVHFQADRDSAAMIEQIMPSVRAGARENRAFHQRVVRYLAEEAGVRQFLDIGCGLPAPANTHEVARGARVVYVDNDPIVKLHSDAFRAEGTAYVEGDLRDPDRILGMLPPGFDLGRPVALLLVAVLHFILDDDDPYGLVARLVDAVPEGSYLVLSNATTDFMPPEQLAILEAANAGADRKDKARLRAAPEVARFFDGLDLVPPGMCVISDWRPADPDAVRPTPADVCAIGGVARIP